MRLPPELYDEVLRALGVSAGEDMAAPGQTRAAPRLLFARDVRIVPRDVALPKAAMVKLRDLSQTGAAFITQQVMQSGDRITLYLPRTSGFVPVVATVRNCRVSGEGFCVGAEFTTHAEDQEPKAPMLGSARGLVARSTPAQAETEEIGAACTITRFDRNGQKSEPLPAAVDEASASGIDIVCYEPMKRGDQFLISIRRREGRDYTGLCEVTHCQGLDAERQHIRAKFIRRARHERGWLGRLWARSEA